MAKSFVWAILIILSAPVSHVQRVGYAATSTTPYRVLDLGDLEQTSSGIVRGLNSSGDVVGASAGLGTGTRAFVLTKTQFENLDGLPGADWSSSHGINEYGVVVGSSNSPTSLRAFIWARGGKPRDLGALPGGQR